MAPSTNWDDLAKRSTANREYGESWMPRTKQHPNPLLGSVTGCNVAHTAEGEEVPVAEVLDRDEKLWSVWLYGKDGGRDPGTHSGWYKQFLEQDPKVGERVALFDNGKVELKSKSGAFYNDLRLTVDRPVINRSFRETLGITGGPAPVAGDIPTDLVDAVVVPDAPAGAGSATADDDIPFGPSVA